MSIDGQTLDSLALLRIEHKLDMILWAMKASGIALSELPSLESYNGDLCPVCAVPIHVTVDFRTERYVRSCGCAPPVRVVAGVSALTKPPAPPPGRRHIGPDDAREEEPEESGPSTRTSAGTPEQSTRTSSGGASE